MINQDAPRLAENTGRRPIRWSNYRKEIAIFALLLVLCIGTSAAPGSNFLSSINIQNLANLIGIYGIFSIGEGIVIITGGIDLSIGSLFALEGVLAAMMLTWWHWNSLETVAACMAVTIGIGLFQGLLITRLNLQPFIVTLCGLLFYRGLARFICGDTTVGFGNATHFQFLEKLASGKICIIDDLKPKNVIVRHNSKLMQSESGVAKVLHTIAQFFHNIYANASNTHAYLLVSSNTPGLPMTFLLMVIIGIIMWIVLHRSVYGRYLYAVGRNEEAARYSGINSRSVITSAYVISGAMAGIAGLLLAFYTNSISPAEQGQSYELYGIAAAVLGGCSLRGGEGTIIGILIGTALLQVLQNLVILLGIPSSLNFSVVGAVILLGVITDELVKRRAAKKVRI